MSPLPPVLSADLPALPLGASTEAGDDAAADPSKILSREECEAVFHRVANLASGGGETSVTIRMAWRGYLNWARNHPTTSGLSRSRRVLITRTNGAAQVYAEVAELDDAALKAAVAKTDGYLQKQYAEVQKRPPDFRRPIEVPGAQQYVASHVWSDVTAKASDQERSDVVRRGVDGVRTAHLLAAGHAEAQVVTWAIFNTRGLSAHITATAGQFSQTVRNAEGTGSGWAGSMHTDWTKLDVGRLSALSLEKCVKSLNPRAIEPGRYTTILEPQAVGSAMAHAIQAMTFEATSENHPYHGTGPFKTKLGQRIMDERLTITSDPADPDGPFIPFDGDGYPYRPVTWVEHGVLKTLAFGAGNVKAREYFHWNGPLLNPTAFRVSASGEVMSIEEMIATTERGLLVTRFDHMYVEYEPSLLLSTVTRDGVWLIEKGKIKFPVKNMRVLDSPLFYCNNLLQVGKPERIFGARWMSSGLFGASWDNFTPMALGNLPMVVPPMKVRDFNFAAMADAV